MTKKEWEWIEAEFARINYPFRLSKFEDILKEVSEDEEVNKIAVELGYAST